jgi:hypothetical protein
MYQIKDIINNYLYSQEYLHSQAVHYDLNPSQRRAVDVTKTAYDRRDVGLIQGPPGTGKTSVIMSSIEELIGKLDRNEVLVYVAPTNKLVHDVLVDTLPILYNIGYATPDDIVKAIRVFGSDFNYKGVPKVRSPIDKDVKIIFTTDYQKFYVSFKDAIERGFSFTFLVDEASKAPLYRFLTPIAMELIRADKSQSKLSIDSLSVVGDPMQAISKKPLYRLHREYLLMTFILKRLVSDLNPDFESLLERSPSRFYKNILDHASKLKNFVMLDTTYRLPDPSHKIISKGFYNDLLRAFYAIDTRLTYNSELIDKFGDYIKWDTIAQKIMDAVKNDIGVIYIRHKDSAYRDTQGQNIDSVRAYVAVRAAIAASVITGKNTTIIPIYRDMVNYISFIMHFDDNLKPYIGKLLNEHKIRISVATAHSFLGAEDENVVLILGKEYLPKKYPPYERYIYYGSTIYFIEPEIFNVQFSRHKVLLIIIGNVERLVRNSNEEIKSYHSKKSRTLLDEILYGNSIMLKNSAQEILDLCGIEVKGNKRKVKSTGLCEVFDAPSSV